MPQIEHWMREAATKIGGGIPPLEQWNPQVVEYHEKKWKHIAEIIASEYEKAPRTPTDEKFLHTSASYANHVKDAWNDGCQCSMCELVRSIVEARAPRTPATEPYCETCDTNDCECVKVNLPAASAAPTGEVMCDDCDGGWVSVEERNPVVMEEVMAVVRRYSDGNFVDQWQQMAWRRPDGEWIDHEDMLESADKYDNRVVELWRELSALPSPPAGQAHCPECLSTDKNAHNLISHGALVPCDDPWHSAPPAGQGREK